MTGPAINATTPDRAGDAGCGWTSEQRLKELEKRNRRGAAPGDGVLRRRRPPETIYLLVTDLTDEGVSLG